jgi:tripartite-type tricarboxylate transporter receptor subunit TctC
MERRDFIVGAASLALAGGLHAQAAPARITVIIPFAPGGPTDQLARVLGEAITQKTGRVVIVDNRPGGGGQIAAAAVKQSPTEGVTLFMGDWAVLGSNAALYTKFSYDPLADFVPITSLASFPMVLYVNAANPANNVAELLAQGAKGNRGLTYGSQGTGTAGHLLGALLQGKSKTPLVHIAYKGSAPAMQDLLANNIDMLFDALPAGQQHVASGKLKALMIMSNHPSPLLPKVPTARDQGLADLAMDVWFGVVAKAGTPKAAVADVHKAFVEALASERVATRLKPMGYEIIPMPSDAFGNYMKTEFARWSQVIKTHHIAID